MRHPEIVSYRVHPNHIELTWPDGTQRTFLYIWLRDNCPTSRHKNGQKMAETYAIPLDISVEKVSLNELGVLEIQWQGEDHISYFDVEVLKRKSIPGPKWTSIVSDATTTWDAQIDINQLSTDFASYMRDDETVFRFLDKVIRFGFGVLRGVTGSSNTVVDVVRRFGHIRETNYGQVFHVHEKMDPENLTDTSLPLSPHTDNPYRDPVPTLQLLHCVESSIEGGDSILVDGFRVAEMLYNNAVHHFNMLATTPISFRYRNEHVWLEASTTFLGVDANGYIKHIRLNNRSIRPFDPNMNRLAEFYRAYFSLLNLVNSRELQIRFKLQPGDLILFDNERILHGRTGFEMGGDRFLAGCYADRDGLLSTWRILKRQYEEKLADGFTIIH